MPNWLPFLFLDYKYIIIFLIAIPEGPILMAVCGFLVRANILSLWPAYIALVIGDFVADIVWYYLGKSGGIKIVHSKFGRFMGLKEKNIEIVEKYFNKYHTSILFVSKLTTGFGFAPVVLFTAGLVKVPFKRYCLVNFIGGFIWTAFLMALGYSFSHLFITIQNINGKMFLVGGSLIILFVVYRIGKYINKLIITKNND